MFRVGFARGKGTSHFAWWLVVTIMMLLQIKCFPKKESGAEVVARVGGARMSTLCQISDSGSFCSDFSCAYA